MKRTPLVLLCAGLVANSVSAELQLKPMLSFYELDGVKFSQVAFIDDKKEVTYAPPTGWECSGSGAQLTLRPKDKAQAEATVTKVALKEPMPFNEETLKKLAEEALASVPSGSTEVHLIAQEQNPVYIEGKETFLVTMSYAFYGDTYGRSIMFMNRG